jgi:polysaccharide biosynthesis protein PelC
MNLMLRRIAAMAAIMLLSACATVDRSEAPAVSGKALWVLLPFANHTETPLAGSRAEAIAEGVLRANGLARLQRYPASLQTEALFEPGDRKQLEASLEWARGAGARYAVTGSVEEWRYKVGVDGEPAVGLSLSVIDVQSGETLWTGIAAKAGWSRDSLAAVAQQLMRQLVGGALSARQD